MRARHGPWSCLKRASDYFVLFRRTVRYSTDVGPLIEPIAESHTACKAPKPALPTSSPMELPILTSGDLLPYFPLGDHTPVLALWSTKLRRSRAHALRKKSPPPYRAGWPCQDKIVAGSLRKAPFLAKRSNCLLKRGYWPKAEAASGTGGSCWPIFANVVLLLKLSAGWEVESPGHGAHLQFELPQKMCGEEGRELQNDGCFLDRV